MLSAPLPVDLAKKSWPVFLITNRRFRSLAKFTASWIWPTLDTLTLYVG